MTYFYDMPNFDEASSTELQNKIEKNKIESLKSTAELIAFIEKLKNKIQAHLNKVSQSNDEIHQQKAKVLTIALEALDGKKNKTELNAAIQESPLYKKAFLRSNTEKLVTQVQDIAKGKRSMTVFQLDTRSRLINQIDAQLAHVSSKAGEMYQHKKAVLEAAKAVVEGKKLPGEQTFEGVINNNPRYKEALFSNSKTNLLVLSALALIDKQQELQDQATPSMNK